MDSMIKNLNGENSKKFGKRSKSNDHQRESHQNDFTSELIRPEESSIGAQIPMAIVEDSSTFGPPRTKTVNDRVFSAHSPPKNQ